MKILKTTLGLLFMVVILVSSFPVQVFAEGDTEIRYGVDSDVKQNGTVSVNICITKPETVDAVQLYLEYDSNCFELDESSSWMLDKNMSFNDKFHSISDFVQNGKGTVSLVHWQEQVKTDANGTIAVVVFKAKSDATLGPSIFNLTYSSNNVAPFVSTLESGKINDSSPHAMKTEIQANKVPEPVREFIKPKPLPVPPPAENQGYVPSRPGIRNGGGNGNSGRDSSTRQDRPRKVLQPIAAVPEEDEDEEPVRIRSKTGKISSASIDKAEELDEVEEEESIDEEEILDEEEDEESNVSQNKLRSGNKKLVSEYGEELSIPVSPLAKHRIPEGFGPQILNIHGLDIQGYTSAKYNLTLYYLQAPNKQATLYTYNKEFDCFEEYAVSKLHSENREEEQSESEMYANAKKSFDPEKDDDKTSPIALAAVSLVGASSFGVFIMSLFKQLRL